MKRLRYLVCVLAFFFLAAAAPAFAQTATSSPGASPSPTASVAPGKPILGAGGWGKYMAVVTVGISALTLLALLGGLAIQGPGFSKADAE